ncbi:alpha/beta hydrolase [Tardiphaga sp. vice352]|uniref:alpha/beta fold hydrolase n=1 Tax=unclassified Tardiphaga TaxID=2631404 RepID=UPI0011658AD6|nr:MULTISPECIES: alpha/beta fold hydrolase [unclassified Tardiphaga]QDM15809.1 alpha/beta hydrolase [Tardiphaga sp. vice278]QDM20910.1 alpha/beta hydrolase [Tardiphaga sp. vice154]QDM26004.1 alpha/beta hydrolase [Tardiphaga sp. vice304]QDM31151.1 alpha/beta hydrolase [Tardiphaga sp. vice352]
MNKWKVAASLAVVAIGGYFCFSKLAIRHESLELHDQVRNRDVMVDVAVRRDAEIKADAGYSTLPVAVISQGNTVKNTEYSFIANALAARGYLVLSIQHDLPSDAPLVTVKGALYAGRLQIYERGEANIDFVLGEMEKRQPHADYGDLTLLGHSNGGDISMYYAKQHASRVKQVVTLDNLRVPFVTDARLKILSFRSHDNVFKADPGVVPDEEAAKAAGIDIVQTDARHTDMSDRGPDLVKESIEATLDRFLSDNSSSDLTSAVTRRLAVFDPQTMVP